MQKESIEFKIISPLTKEEFVKILNAEEEFLIWDTHKLSLSEVIEKYGNVLTDEQITKLKEHGKDKPNDAH